MTILLRFPKLREAYRTRHPLKDRLVKSEAAATWMLIIGALWALQHLLQGG